MTETAQTGVSPDESLVKKAEDFMDFYANNALLQSTLWDLRILFGQVDQTLKDSPSIYNLSVRIPWPQVKLMLYFLTLHLSGYETKNGRIKLPPGMVPEFPTCPPQGGEPDDEWRALRRVWEQFVAENPEAQ
jgi:hypothetical protein